MIEKDRPTIVPLLMEDGETFTQWNKRFVKERKRDPFSMDYHLNKHLFRVQLPVENEEDTSRVIVQAMKVLAENFSEDNARMTNDASVWFLNEDDALLFKLLFA